MNKDTLINMRVTKPLKESFQNIVEGEDFTMSEVLEACMLDVAKHGYVPMNLRGKIARPSRSVLSIPFIKSCVDGILEKMGDPRIRSVSLFGSYSKGTANHSSDIDLFLDVEEGYDLFAMAELQINLEKELGKKVDLVTRTDDIAFLNHIRKEWIRIYDRDA